MWDSPVYRFRLPIDQNNESSKLKEIIIDVTGSAPSMMKPSEELVAILNEIFDPKNYGKIETVLDFGAAKLRNVPFLLERGKKVCAVEFEELMENEKAKLNLEKCHSYGEKFRSVVFPNPFIQHDEQFDLAILMNVIPVMPVMAERMYLLDILHSKIDDEKYLLWIAQKEGGYKKDRESGKYPCGDGIWMMKDKRFKTFYRYHPVDEVIEIMLLYGFEKVKRFNKGSSDALLFKKIKHTPFAGMLTEEKILQELPLDTTIADPVSPTPKIVSVEDGFSRLVPNPHSLSVEQIYIEKLKSLEPGKNDEIYHRVASCAMSRIFRHSLRNMDIKRWMDDGMQIIDTVFTNDASSGFFKSIRERYGSQHIIIEFKDINNDPKNTEFQQLNGRLGDRAGSFGILGCRSVADKDAVIHRCRAYLQSKHCLIYITDEDLIELLECSRENNIDAIEEYIDARLKDILF